MIGFFPYKSLYFERYATMPMLTDAHISSLCYLWSNQPVCFEGWNKFSVPIWYPWKTKFDTRRSGCQLSLLSINFDFRNVIFQPMVFPFVCVKYKWNLWEIVVSSPFLGPSRLHRSLARSRETHFTRPNRRECSQAIMQMTRNCISRLHQELIWRRPLL